MNKVNVQSQSKDRMNSQTKFICLLKRSSYLLKKSLRNLFEFDSIIPENL
ncbi:hypothetical protein LEP1GSC008_1440 [Leptospira kirschneri serovar Bulgarica str. Nikolaevo]|uniref:Uncharacterized protein n=1 Tax=Leptospira kirschneri serovar Bulgarica str. Nikolaevo TaxID=1240687 RepID=M6F4C9_9LEPT|nr:hypothetical protein LEP1GSC008_1440 [Leptospira kirschneri serovar Bulgarica str. Nikolaevo]